MDSTPVPPVRPVPPVPRALREARTVAWVLDDLVRVPGTRRTVGLDPLLGLLPGLGDWLGWAASAHLLVAAARLGAPVPVILRMAGNALIDAAVGAVPVVGDLFDFGWKANRKNLALLERMVADPASTARASRLVIGLVAGGVGGATVAAAVGAIVLFRWLLGMVGAAL